MIFVEATEANHLSTRLIGDNIDTLLTEAMKYVTVCKDFYRTIIREKLESGQIAIVSHFSCPFPNGLLIFYDPNHKITEKEANILSYRELREKYASW